ncbi:MAG: sulfatase [Anaerolineales bacterium]|nr:sulfatase [Anaerolineales bacterium]NUQ86670.1 sulfatase [Anaerolineales bacterium]
MRRKTHLFYKAVLALLMLFSIASCAAPFQTDRRPNFLVIVTDDQRLDTMEYMPNTQSLIFDQGVTFANGFVTTPLCCPSRASILTGMYAHNHGVRENEDKLNHTTFMEVMRDNGYYTGLVGKYLNSWKGEPRPEYDYWVSFFKGETVYYSPDLNVNGEWLRHKDQYVTYVLGDYAVDFLDKAARQDKPFILLFAPNAPHRPTTPAVEDEGLLTDLEPHRPPSFNEEDMSDKPAWLANRSLLTEEEIVEIDAYRRDQLLTLISLDRTIARVIARLQSSGELDRTMVIFISDNGQFLGEHRFGSSKNRYYEENVHVPFAIRYPPLVPEPYAENKLAANIDIAPTLFDLAGIPIPVSMDGESLVKLLRRDGPWREYLLLEGGILDGSYVGVRSERYFYGENDGYPEFYDLLEDPYQLQNLIGDPDHRDLIAQYKTLMDQMQQPKFVPTITP